MISIGQLGTDVIGLNPLNPDHKITGASSDIIVVNLGNNPKSLKIGDSIKFKVNYSALLRPMSGKYFEKVICPALEEFQSLPKQTVSGAEPALQAIDEQEL